MAAKFDAKVEKLSRHPTIENIAPGRVIHRKPTLLAENMKFVKSSTAPIDLSLKQSMPKLQTSFDTALNDAMRRCFL